MANSRIRPSRRGSGESLFDQSNQLSRATISCPVEGGFSVLISMADRAAPRGIEQRLASLDVDAFGMKRRDGGHERTNAGSADGVDVGPPFEEIRDHLRICPPEAASMRLVASNSFAVDIEPGTEQLLDEIDTAPACGFAELAVAPRPADRARRSCFQQSRPAGFADRSVIS